MYQMKRFIDMEHSLCLPVCFCFCQLGLCSVSCTANEYSIYHFSIITEDFFISFLKSDYCRRLRNYNFLCVICIQICICILRYFLLNHSQSRNFNSPFILYISTAKVISLVRGYIGVKISKHDIW